MSHVNARIGEVKNRAPAKIQITAEQLILESTARQDDKAFEPPKQLITDPQELEQYRMYKRKEYEDSIRRQRQHIGTWMKYALWEAEQKEFARARSVFERALDVEYKNITIWRKYAEMEMKNKFINHARNILDRAVNLLPRVDQLWYKYVWMEEKVENVQGARGVYERWMRWEPNEQAWLTYVKFEERGKNLALARKVLERYIRCHPTETSYIRFAKWEERHHQKALARDIFERALKELPEEEEGPDMYISFAKFEERCREYARARTLYKYALDNIPKSRAGELYKEFIAFEKQHGNRKGIEEVIANKRRFQYETRLSDNPHDYDTWFDYVRLEESYGLLQEVREVYERAIANIPPLQEKQYWRRYIYLWINYAVYEEMTAKDNTRARAVYDACIRVVPHKKFTFAKIWTMYAHFEVRHGDLPKARKILGRAIGMCPKERLFKTYIQLELNLVEVDRCRKLYNKYLEWAPTNCLAWTKFAEMEASVNEVARCRALYELAIQQEVLDMPELLWKAYIDFEIKQKEYQNARVLYDRLLERTGHVKVFISYAQFEASINQTDNARSVFERAFNTLRENDQREECVMLLEAWEGFELAQGEEQNRDNIEGVRKKMPRRIKKKRMIQLDDGSNAGWEEYFDYIFPDDESNAAKNLRILELAHKWQKKDIDIDTDSDSSGDDSENEETEGEVGMEIEQDDDEIDLGDL